MDFRVRYAVGVLTVWASLVSAVGQEPAASKPASPAAMFESAQALHHGQGVPQNLRAAMDLYLRAARLGHAPAQLEVSRLYELGLGAVRDDRRAVFWGRQAADQGLAEAQYRMALLYFTGDSVQQDYVEAHVWASLAAKQQHAGAASLLPTLEGTLNDEQRAGAARRVVAFQLVATRAVSEQEELAAVAVKEERKEVDPAALRERAVAGDHDAQVALGLMLYWGEGIPRDEPEAVKWFRAAAGAGHVEGQFSLGVTVFSGHGVPADPVEGYRWMLIAAAQGHRGATVNLDFMRPEMTDEQFARARALAAGEAAAAAENAARAWNAVAQHNLAEMFLLGYGKPYDPLQAAKWWILSAGSGHQPAVEALQRLRVHLPDDAYAGAVKLAQAEMAGHLRRLALRGDAGAQVALGRLLRDGRGMARDPALAWAWFALAAAQGDAAGRDAQTALETELSAGDLERGRQALATLRADTQPAPAKP
jgi:uncharacterized protein